MQLWLSLFSFLITPFACINLQLQGWIMQRGDEKERDLSPVPELKEEDISLEDRVTRFEKELIEQALRQTNFIQTNAAKLLKTTRRIINIFFSFS